MIIADDHHVVRAGMRHLLKQKSHWQVVGEASCPAQLMEMLATRHCELLICDYSMPSHTHPDGALMVSALRARYPALKILVMTMLSNPALLNHIRDVGADAVVEKSSRPSSILATIEVLLSGHPHPPTHAHKADTRLNPAQMEMARMLGMGRNIEDIARATGLTEVKVMQHKRDIMHRLGVIHDVDFRHCVAAMGLSPPLPNPYD